MNADRLLAHYERIADAPDAIPRLRRFILDLAVRGKLVPQDPKDELASELRKRIVNERARRVKAGEIRRAEPSIPIHDDELPITLPKNWAWLRLHDIGVLSGGMTPSMDRSDFWDGDIVWLSPKDIKADEVFDSELKITAKGLSETRLETYRPGCLFMVARSGILKRTFPVSINRVPAAANQDMKVLVPFLDGHERYLQIMFRGLTDFILRELVKTGTTVQSLKYAEFEEQPFPIPPLAEQHRIIAKVDELIALCDRLEEVRAGREAMRDRLATATLRRLNAPDPDQPTFAAHCQFAANTLAVLTTRLDQIKQLRQTILNLAVRGRLVAQDPNEERASELLKRVAAERDNRIKMEGLKPPKATAEFDARSKPFPAPNGWAWVRFGQLIHHSKSGWSPKTENFERTDNNWGVLKVSAVSWDRFDPSENKQLLPNSRPRLSAQVHQGDFLISRANTSDLVAKCVIVDHEPHRLMMSDKIVRLRLTELCEPRFVLLVNNAAAHARLHYAENASGVSPSMKNISRPVIFALPFPLPPLAEQRRIVAKVYELMMLCDQLETSLTTSDDTRHRLLDALLAEALASGERIVPEERERVAAHA